MADFQPPAELDRIISRFRPFLPPPVDAEPGAPIVYTPQPVDLGDPILQRNPYGLPIRSLVEIAGGRYTDPATGRVVAYNGLKLPEALVTLNRAKSIVKTAVNGRSSTVKEFAGFQDWQVTINYTFWEPRPYTYPIVSAAVLRDLERVPGPVRVQGGVFDVFQIYYLVIERVDLLPSSSRNLQAFNLTASSDEPLEVELLAGN